jgi:hypothetical protein
MAEDSYPSSARAAGVLTDAEYEALAALYVPSGIFGLPTDPYPVYTAGDANRGVRFRAGSVGLVRGARYATGGVDVIVQAAANSSGSNRLDLAVWECDHDSDNEVRAAIKTGSSATVPPTPTQQAPGAGVWQFPVAVITVPTGATTLAADKTAKCGWWLAPPPLLTSTTSQRPPNVAGQGIFEFESASRLVGNGAGNWVGTIADSGWVNCTMGPGMTAGGLGCKARRINGVAYGVIMAQRTGGALGNGQDVKLCQLPAGFEPNTKQQCGGYLDGGNIWEGEIRPDGSVWALYYNTAPPNGATFGAFSPTWPVG